MTKMPIPALATSVAGSHYRNVGLVDVKSRPQSLVILVTSKVLVVPVGAKLQSLLIDSLRLCMLSQ